MERALCPALACSERRKAIPACAMVESLESRTLMADGITPLSGFPALAAPGVKLDKIAVASFRVTDSSAPAGSSWRAQIDWGDGLPSDKQVVPVANPDGSFSILGSHAYEKPGQYTVTVQIAVPRSGTPDHNTVTTRVFVVQPSPLTASGRSFAATTRKPFLGAVAQVAETGLRAKELHATITWGDATQTTGQIRPAGSGRFSVLGRFRFRELGTQPVVVSVSDAQGNTAVAISTATIRGSVVRNTWVIPR